MWRTLAFALACALILTGMAGGAKPRALTGDQVVFTLAYNGREINQPVDWLTWCGDCAGVDYTTGSPWVVNPTECMWDSDDAYSYTSAGGGTVLDAGASVSVSECILGSGSMFPTAVSIDSSSPDLLVTESWTWDAGSKSTRIVPFFDTTTGAHRWRYLDCVWTPFPSGGSVFTVPGSNGGMGILERVTVTVANPTSRKVGKTGGLIVGGIIPVHQLGFVPYNSPDCRQP